MKYTHFMGIDPGGGIAMIRPNREISCWVMPESLKSLNELLLFYITKPHGERTFCAVEMALGFPEERYTECPSCKTKFKTHKAMKGHPKFLKAAGGILGILTAHEISFEEFAPITWQVVFGLVAGRGERIGQVEKKNKHKAKAKALWPEHANDITHKTADAMLLAEFARMSRR